MEKQNNINSTIERKKPQITSKGEGQTKVVDQVTAKKVEITPE